MAGKSTISITFKLDGDAKGFDNLIKGSDGLKASLRQTLKEAQQLNGRTINFAAISTGINSAMNSLVQLQNVLQGLGDAYAVQEAAERKLETVMKQRMQASDAEIQSVKNLASAQQSLGIVGDEVQLSGAQQLATFLYDKQSLDVLIPAMNNLIAQQKGYEATTQDAVNIGNMMGKVMMGQTAALKRVGVSFSEAEGEVLKYGNEEEKAAMLAKVITQNVGNMNAELAKTDSGRLKQVTNTLGDYKEQLGGIVKNILPYLTIASQTSIALGGVVTLTHGVKMLAGIISVTTIKSHAAAAGMAMLGLSARRSAATVRIFGAAMKGAAYKATALKIALRGLMIATGVGAAIAAVTLIIEQFTASTDEAADKEGDLIDETKNLERGMRDLSEGTARYSQKEITTLDQLYRVAKDETKSRKERAAAITQLKNMYPSYFSAMNTEKINVANLTTQYNMLRDSIIQSARARAAQDKIIENEKERLQIEEKQRELLKQKIKAQKEFDAAQEAANRAAASISAADKERIDNYYRNNNSQYTEGASSLNTGHTELESYAAAALKARSALQQLNKVIGERNKLQHEYYMYGLSNDYLKDVAADMPATPTPTPVAGGKVTIADEKKQTAVMHEKALTIQEIDDNIAILREMQKTASEENIANINREIQALEERRSILMNKGVEKEENAAPTDEGPKWTAKPQVLKEYEDNITILNQKLQTASMAEAATINGLIDEYQEKADAIRNMGRAAEETGTSIAESMIEGWNAAKGFGNSIEGISGAIRGNGNAWQRTQAIIDGVIGLYQGFTAVSSIIQALTGLSWGHTEAKTAESVAETGAAAATDAAAAQNVVSAATQIATNKAAAASFKQLAAAQYMAAHAYIPFVGFTIGAGFVESMEALVAAAGLPLLAKGGIASGPTLAMVGEYGGAASNPEVIAPLDKLRSLIGTNEGNNEVRNFRFVLKGRDLIALEENERNLRRKS